MEIKYIDEFLYLADTLSYKRTAEHFYVSRSVISRHISALEDTVGARLLDRDSHAVQLTKAGEAFAREAHGVMRDWERAIELARQVAQSDQVLVRLGYLKNAARPVLAQFVREMTRRHPNVKLVLACMDHNELVRALAEHYVDVALAVNVNPGVSKNYRHTPIYSDHYTIVCALDHPLASRVDGISLDELANQTVLVPDSYVYGGTSDFVGGLVDDESLFLARSLYSDTDMLRIRLEAEGLLAFSSTMNNEIFNGRLAVLPIMGVDTSFRVSAFYHGDFEGAGFAACCEVFEWCNDQMCTWYPDLALNDCE